jgi:hypothetical protein
LKISRAQAHIMEQELRPIAASTDATR